LLPFVVPLTKMEQLADESIEATVQPVGQLKALHMSNAILAPEASYIGLQ
jgi:hypothetical protein